MAARMVALTAELVATDESASNPSSVVSLESGNPSQTFGIRPSLSETLLNNREGSARKLLMRRSLGLVPQLQKGGAVHD